MTLVADHLEELGLIERQHPTDRRVKNLVLTDKGKRFKKTIPGKVWGGSAVAGPPRACRWSEAALAFAGLTGPK